jgi:hypothetical protein
MVASHSIPMLSLTANQLQLNVGLQQGTFAVLAAVTWTANKKLNGAWDMPS